MSEWGPPAVVVVHRPRLSPYLVLTFGVLSIAFSPILVRWSNAPGAISSFYRMAIAAGILVIPFALRLKRRLPFKPGALGLAILGGVLFAADIGLWSEGIMLSGATNPTLMGNTAPIWVGLGASIFLKERLNRRFWLGLVIALSGALIILGLDSLEGLRLGMGTLLGLLAGGFYAAYILITQRAREKLDALSYFWVATASATVSLWLIGNALGYSFLGYPNRAVISFLGLGIVVQVMGWLAISYALGYLPATLVSPSLLGQPVLAAGLAYFLLGERFTSGQVIGGIAVLIGILVVHWSRRE